MELIYLDYNCFQRGFDDPRQLKIRLEALVCEGIFTKAEREEAKLVWSFMHEDENAVCPFIERKLEVFRLSALCTVRIGPQKEIYSMAKNFQSKTRLTAKDAIHLACAHTAGCTFFLTRDEELIKHAQRLDIPMRIMNPIDFMREVDKNESTTV